MDIPIRVYLLAYPPTTPVILASHGQGGSRMTRPYLGSGARVDMDRGSIADTQLILTTLCQEFKEFRDQPTVNYPIQLGKISLHYFVHFFQSGISPVPCHVDLLI